MAEKVTKGTAPKKGVEVVYKFCDLQRGMVTAWKNIFKEYIPERVQVKFGDIFKDGPAADAIVSPANSFGFMDGGIDMVYSQHFGWQLQERLQKIIRTEYHGELLVGQAIILPTEDSKDWVKKDFSSFNEGKPIKYLVSAPTMRAPWDVSDTPNAYLAFRGIILAVQKFNADLNNEPIRSVLVPGLGTAVGRMPCLRCAYQMLHAYEIFELGLDQDLIHPQHLWTMMSDQVHMVEFGNDAKTARKNKEKREGSGEAPSTKSLAELRKDLESLAPHTDDTKDVKDPSRDPSTDTNTAEPCTEEKADKIPTVLDLKDIV